MHRGYAMRTTLDLPEKSIKEAMSLTQIPTKAELIKVALENIIEREKVRGLTKYFDKVSLDIDMGKIRKR
jgi:hypothetical protein